VTPNKNIFCNTPWYELHIYWDGSLGICCSEDHKLYDSELENFNIATTTIKDWFNSEPAKKFRKDILGNQRLSQCRRCYTEEDHDGHSRRLKTNQKSVIFTRTAFDQSFQQSPGFKHFKHSYDNQGHTNTLPIDMHIDLGNYCNLACKMCSARASSTIASQEVRWGIESSKQYLGSDWTKDPAVWSSFKQQLLDITNLNQIHFMGGETLLTDRFEDLVDFMTQHKKFNLCFSFVTNGTVYKPALIEKLKRFRRVGIEVSLEAVDDHNAYQRQGTDTALVLANLQKYMQQCNGTSITVALRPAPSLLSIGYYDGVLQYALDHQLIVKSNLCYNPRFLSAEILPTSVKQFYLHKYQKLISQLAHVEINSDYNASDPHNFLLSVRQQAEMCMNLLQTPEPPDSATELEAMVRHCERWDRVYGYDAQKLYPEFKEIFDRHGYNISG